MDPKVCTAFNPPAAQLSIIKLTYFFTSFPDIQGPLFPKPRFLTLAKMRWDDYYLYIGAYLEETDVWANQTKHDSVSKCPIPLWASLSQSAILVIGFCGVG